MDTVAIAILLAMAYSKKAIRQPTHAPAFTRFTGRSPTNAANRLSTAQCAIASRVSWVAEPMCGVATTLSSCNSGESALKG